MSFKNHLWKTLRLFVIIFMIASALLLLVALAHYWQTTLKDRTDFENNEISIVFQGKTAIEQQLAGVVSDINFLGAYGEHYRLIGGRDTSLFDNLPKQKQTLTRLLKIFSQEKKVFDQIRFLGLTGAELIRINYNQDKPVVVADQHLQQKSSRYYVRELGKLKKNALYVSPFDLNIEQGKIELPYKPVLRFGIPVFNAQGERKGFLLLNLKGEQLLHAFRIATRPSQDHSMLLNKQGYWLSSPDKAQEWGFMFGKQDNFTSHHADAWKVIRAHQSGQFYSGNFLFTFSTVNPLPASMQDFHSESSVPGWKVVSLVPRSHPSLGGAFDAYVSLYGSILLLLALGSWLLANAIIRHRQSEIQVAFEQRFRQVLENVDLLALGLDKNGTIIFCNDALATLIGWDRQDLLGQNWFENCISDADRQAARSRMDGFLFGGVDDVHQDVLIKTRDNDIRKVAWNHAVMKDPEGEILGLTCIGENVTDIRAQEKQVLTLSRAVEQSPVVVMIVDIYGGIQYINPRFTEISGYTLDEVRGKNPRLLRSEPLDVGEICKYQALWKKISAGGTWQGIFKNKKKNGEIYWVSASISGLRDAAGKIVNYIGVQEDITERLSLEKKFRMSVEGSPYAMVMIDAEGKIILINTRTEEYFGYHRDEIMGKTVEMLVPETYQQSHIGLREQFVATQPAGIKREHGIGRHVSGKRKNGTEFPVEIALSLIKTDEGHITLASIIDITQRRELEKKLEQRNQEIAKSKTLAVVGRMASMVAHDLRNPLSSIKMGLQILSKPEKPGTEEQLRELKEIALQQVDYMEVLLEDLLNYASPAALKPEWISIERMLIESTHLLQGLIASHQVMVRTDIESDLPELYADPGKLTQVFSNLLSNAIQSALESGKQTEIQMTVKKRQLENKPVIQVQIMDNGKGIDDDHVEHLFEPFFTTRSTGSGLGLAIVKRFIDQHQGNITLESNPVGEGVVCTVVLPISQEPG